MIGHRFFGARYFGPRYFGPAAASAGHAFRSLLFQFGAPVIRRITRGR